MGTGAEMRRWGTACLAALLAASCGATASAAVLHVSPLGDDGADGDASRPLRTLQRAADRMRAGDTVIVHAGTYRETVRPAAAGTADHPLRFLAAQGERSLVCGTEPVTGWRIHRGAVRRAEVPQAPMQVFVNGRAMVRARFPNASTNVWTLNTVLLKPVTNGVLTGDLPDRERDYWKGATAWGLSERLGWVAAQFAVTGSVGRSVFYQGPRVPWYGGGTGHAYLSGVLGELDQENEWHWEDGTLYLWAPGGADPSDLTVEVAVRSLAFDLSGRSHVIVRGLHLFAASVSLDGARDCLLEGMRVQWPCVRDDIRGNFNRDRAFGARSEGLGLVLGGTNNAIRGCVVAYSTGDGISMFGASNRVENCVVHDCNTSASDCSPVGAIGLAHIIRRSTLFHGGRSVLAHRHLRSGRIEANDMRYAGLLCNDMGVTYTYQTDGMGTTIAWNRIAYNLGRSPGCVGIYLDDMSQNHFVHHNIVWGMADALVVNPPASKGHQIYHNTLDPDGTCIGMSWERPQNMEGARVANNIFTKRISPKLPDFVKGTNLLKEVDARFVDAANRDYRLREDSPAVDAGEIAPPWSDGFLGKAPDLGALERGAEPVPVGSDIPETEWMMRPEWRLPLNHRGPAYGLGR